MVSPTSSSLIAAPAWSPQVASSCPAALNSGPRRRILISAFAVSPVRGSEPAVGWNIARRLADHHDITVLCAPRHGEQTYREEVEAHLRQHGPVPGLSFEYVDLPPMARLLQRDRRDTLLRAFYYVGYASWQRAALRRARELHRRQPFDLVHQLVISGYREPGYLWTLGLPFVWGPLGGAANCPWPYMRLLNWHARICYGMRNLANEFQKRTRRRSRRAAHAADHIWVNSEESRQMVCEGWGLPATRLSEAGTHERPEAAVRRYDGVRPLRLVWIGMIAALKALPIFLHALALRRDDGPGVDVTIVGTGPQEAHCRALARRLELDDRIRWAGGLSHLEALAEINQADALVFTSLQEGTPHVVLEALSLGVPVICHDACGMGEAVTPACGIKVPMRSLAGSTEGFAAAIRALQDRPELIEQLSAGAIGRSMELSWNQKARQIAEAYRQVLDWRGRGGAGA